MTGTNTERVRPERRSPDEQHVIAGLTRYDVTLATIPLLFALAFFATLLLEVTLPTALAGASTLGLGLIVDNAFRNPPGATR